MAVTSFYYDGSNEPKLAPLSSNGRSTPLIPKVLNSCPQMFETGGGGGFKISFQLEKL